MPHKITCKQATDYISKKEEGRLSASQRVALWRHLAICSLCRLFSRQSKMMSQAARESDSLNALPGLSPEEKEQIINEVLQHGE